MSRSSETCAEMIELDVNGALRATPACPDMPLIYVLRSVRRGAIVAQRHLDAPGVVDDGHDHLLAVAAALGELGFADFEFATWFAVVVPAGTPRAIIERLNAEIAKAAPAPDVRDALLPLGYDVAPGSPEQLTESIRAGLARIGRIIREAGIKAD